MNGISRIMSAAGAVFGQLLILGFVLLGAVPGASAATHTCDPQGYASVIGVEAVAVECIQEGMNDDRVIRYLYRDYACVNGVVTMTQVGNKIDLTPNQLMTPANGIQARTFRNKQGSYFLKVVDDYRGLIDGKRMTDYPVGGVYEDVFTHILDTTQAPPLCRGGDGNHPCNEENTGSSVNVGTGRLSHDQMLFSLNNNRTLSLGVTLNYRSTPFAPSAIGNGWSHTYEATLKPGAGNAMLFWEDGTRRVYERYQNDYVAPKGDYSRLVRNADNSWTITELDGLVRSFDANGNLTVLTDRYGNSLSFTYNGGRLAGVTDATGRSVTLGYEAGTGKLNSVTDPAGNSFTLGYNGGNLASVTQPGGKGQWLYTYGANGLLETKQDPGQQITVYAYHPDNRLKSATDKLGAPILASSTNVPAGIGMVPDAYNWNYFDFFKPVPQTFTYTAKDGNGWVYTYDPVAMRISSATDPNGKVTNYYYNPDTTTLRAITVPFDGAVRLTTFYSYDANGNLLSETEPADLTTHTPAVDPQTLDVASLATLVPPIKTAFTYSYDTAANYYQLKTVTDLRGTTPQTVTYDRYTEPDGQGGSYLVTRRTAPGQTAGATVVSYLRQNGNGTIAGITDAGNGTTTFSYYPIDLVTKANGSAGLLRSATFPDGVRLNLTAYDKNGNLIAYRLTDANNADLPVTTVLDYDPLNRLTILLRESTAAIPKFPANRTKYDYDNNGNRTAITDAENHTTSYQYTQQGQVTEITDARQKTTRLDYGAASCPSCNSGADRLTAVRDANHVASGNPGTVYSYDKVGRLETETDPMGKKIRYTYYDGGNRREKIDATNPTAEKVLITYSYDTDNRLTRKRYADASEETYTYYPDGRLWSATNAAIGYTFTYHVNGWLKSVTDTNGRTISYDDYGPLGQKKQVTYFPTTPDQKQLFYGYDSANRLKTITGPAGTFTYGYDPQGRRESLTYPNQIVASYGYDDLQRLTSLSHQSQSTAIAGYGYTHDQVGNRKTKSGTINETYDYDELYRLTQATTAKGTESYTYDPVGNRKTGPGPKDTKYQYDAANRQTSGKVLSYLYDNQGNQTSRLTANPDKSWTLAWDYENRLTRIEKNKGAEKQTVSFKYDPFGRRIEKKLTTATKTITWTYVYDGDDIALEIESDGTTTTKTFYTHGQNIDEHLALERNGSFYYYHADGLGSVTAITDANRNVVQRYSYDSFGRITAQNSFKSSYTFTSREYDPQTGLYYYRARYYDPVEGRFISKDPIGFDGEDVTLYGYVQNNPINFTDPSGLRRCFNFDKFASQVEQNRASNALTLGSLITDFGIGTMPKTPAELRSFGPSSLRNPYTSQLSRWSGRFGTRALRELGRTTAGIAAGAIATAAVVGEGFYDWGVIGKAAWDATSSDDCGCQGR